jgi:hypothetical protein
MLWEERQKFRVRIIGVLAEIWSQHLPNTSLERYRYANLHGRYKGRHSRYHYVVTVPTGCISKVQFLRGAKSFLFLIISWLALGHTPSPVQWGQVVLCMSTKPFRRIRAWSQHRACLLTPPDGSGYLASCSSQLAQYSCYFLLGMTPYSQVDF